MCPVGEGAMRVRMGLLGKMETPRRIKSRYKRDLQVLKFKFFLTHHNRLYQADTDHEGSKTTAAITDEGQR
jgi:hypothetical protein